MQTSKTDEEQIFNLIPKIAFTPRFNLCTFLFNLSFLLPLL